MRTRSLLKLKVSEIANKLEQGESTTKILTEYTQKHGFKRRTIERYIALAKDIMSTNLKKREAVIEAVRADYIAEEAEKWLCSTMELEMKLCAIVRCKIRFPHVLVTKEGIQVTKEYPTCREVLSAVNMVLRLRGAYKNAEADGNDIKPVLNVIVDNQKEKELIESIRKLM